VVLVAGLRILDSITKGKLAIAKVFDGVFVPR
jgi:hypothetical protein